MSTTVTLSDTFYEALEAKLKALVAHARDPDTDTHFNYIDIPMYEYDTQVGRLIDEVFQTLPRGR